MAIEINLIRATGLPSVTGDAQYITKKAPIGFSWTTLFFGCLPSFFRKDWFNGFLILFVYLLVEMLHVVIALGLAGHPMLPAILSVFFLIRLTVFLVFASTVNHVYNRKLAKTWNVDWEGTKKNNPKADHEYLRTKLVRLGYLIVS